MTRWTQTDLNNYMAKHEVDLKTGSIPADEGPESLLQGKIVKYCKDHGYPCLSFRQSRKAEGFLVPGWPDLTICLPKGTVLFLELKSKKGNLSKEQKEISRLMLYLGHPWRKVTSYKQFLLILQANG